MDAFETTGSLIAVVLAAVAVYFAWRQRLTFQSLRGDLNVSRDQRRYLVKQTGRRLFGSFLLMLLAVLFAGSLFLDYEPTKIALENADLQEAAGAKQAAVRFLILYWMVMLLVLMVILALAVFDLWDTTRFGVQQQKQLAQEHQNALEAELARLRQRRSELN